MGGIFGQLPRELEQELSEAESNGASRLTSPSVEQQVLTDGRVSYLAPLNTTSSSVSSKMLPTPNVVGVSKDQYLAHQKDQYLANQKELIAGASKPAGMPRISQVSPAVASSVVASHTGAAVATVDPRTGAPVYNPAPSKGMVLAPKQVSPAVASSVVASHTGAAVATVDPRTGAPVYTPAPSKGMVFAPKQVSPVVIPMNTSDLYQAPMPHRSFPTTQVLPHLGPIGPSSDGQIEKCPSGTVGSPPYCYDPQDPMSQCIAGGGIWDPVQGTCNLPAPPPEEKTAESKTMTYVGVGAALIVATAGLYYLTTRS